MKKWGVSILIVAVIAALYFIEFSKIKTDKGNTYVMPTLDEISFDSTSGSWEYFYKVRATIIDGQTAKFDIPYELQAAEGKEMKLTGAAIFFSTGCQTIGDKVSVHSFYLYPTLGLANACVHLPEVAMRWTIRIHLKDDWLLTRTEMIDAQVKVKGIFQIDTSKPYESAFFINNATLELQENKEVQF